MDIALLMDIDGTLTAPRAPLGEQMALALGKLTVPFHVAAGSHRELVEPQFLKPLHDFGFRRDFEAFLNNGASHYHCPFSDRFAVEEKDEFHFQRHLGEADYASLVATLERALAEAEFRLPPQVCVIGEQIVDRVSMLNFCPIGRPAGALTARARRNRDEFAAFDRASGYRRKMLSYLERELKDTMGSKGLLIMYGGQTSFDLVIDGQDKTKGVRTLLSMGARRVVFIGDALYEGGNDSVIIRFIEQWRGSSPCPLTAVPVESWQDTIEKLRDHGWLAE